MNGDGALEVVVGGALTQPPLRWWENQEGATMWVTHTIPVTLTEELVQVSAKKSCKSC